MNILPIQDAGIIVTGRADPSIEIWNDKRLLTVTALPKGRCVLPMASGSIRLRSDDATKKILLEPGLLAKPADGPYTLRGNGVLQAWPFDGDPDHGLLAGGEPTWVSERRLELEDIELPRGIDRIAVQVRHGERVGPIRLLRHRPRPEPVPLTVDNDVGSLGPRSNLRFNLPEGQELVLVVQRDVRQTGETLTAEYHLHAGEDVVSMDDLLHGDTLTLSVDPPHALQDDAGHPVRTMRFQYHAVPEARLVALGGSEPIRFQGGLAPLEPHEVEDALKALDPAGFHWSDEWPVVSDGGARRDVISAFKDAGITPDDARDAPMRRWWLQVLENRQSPSAARRLASMRITAAPDKIDAVARAIQLLDGFPSHVFEEIGADRVIADRVMEFQESIGLEPRDGDHVIDLARDLQAALRGGADAWRDAIRDAGLQWVDGTLPPLDDAPSLDQLHAQLVDDPGAALHTLRELRRRIWQTIQVPSDEIVQRPDLHARKALVAAQMAATEAVLSELADMLQSAGIPCKANVIANNKILASSLGGTVRVLDAAMARVHEIPVRGPRFIERAARYGRGLSERLQSTIGAWAGAGVPVAVRNPAQRLLDTCDDLGLARLGIWASFITRFEDMVHDVEDLLDARGDVGATAARVRDALIDAHRRNDPSAFARVALDYGSLEERIENNHRAWAETLQKVSAATRKILGLDGTEPDWNAIERRIDLDAAEIRNLGRLAMRVPGPMQRRLIDMLGQGGGLDNALMAVQNAHTESQRALAVADYDRVRGLIASWLGTDDVQRGLRVAYVEAIAQRAQDVLDKAIGDIDAPRTSALHTFGDIDGARELVLIASYLDVVQNTDPTSAEAIDDAEGMEQVLDHLHGAEDAWDRIGDAILVRLRAAFPELMRYLGPNAPRWTDVDHVDGAVRWLYHMSRGQKDPVTGTDLAVQPPGTRRLVEHTLKERGLWLV